MSKQKMRGWETGGGGSRDGGDGWWMVGVKVARGCVACGYIHVYAIAGGWQWLVGLYNYGYIQL